LHAHIAFHRGVAVAARRRWINQDGTRGEPTIANDATVSSDLTDKSKTEKDSCVCETVRLIFAEALARYGVQSRRDEIYAVELGNLPPKAARPSPRRNRSYERVANSPTDLTAD
jgi:hypothetical protein